jgi:hypothetical protein
LSRKKIYFACFLLHFLLIISVCCRDTFSVLEQGDTVFPPSLQSIWREAEAVTSAALGQHLAISNPLRQGLAAYMNGAGIEAGYGFFAPHVPSNYKLVFEVHYSDGKIEYELPNVGGADTGLRIATLLDYVGQTHHDPLRELLLKMLAYSTWQSHPDAVMIRAVFGFVTLPSVNDFQRGQKESYEFLYAYDFRFRKDAAEVHSP